MKISSHVCTWEGRHTHYTYFMLGNNYINCVCICLPPRRISCESFTMISEVESESSKLIFSHLANELWLFIMTYTPQECETTCYYSQIIFECVNVTRRHSFLSGCLGGCQQSDQVEIQCMYVYVCVCWFAGQIWRSLNLRCDSNYFWLLFAQTHAKPTFN